MCNPEDRRQRPETSASDVYIRDRSQERLPEFGNGLLSGGGLGEVDAVILAGGLGTRLRSVLADRPKPLAMVAGHPFLAWILDVLADAGVRRAVICTGYMAEMVEHELGQRHGPLELCYSREDLPRGTGGAVMDALAAATSDTILALNGDSICLADLNRFAAEHRRRATAASLLLTQVADSSRYGRVELADDARVTAFVEKGGQPSPGWINAGVYLLRRDLLLTWPAAEGPVSLEREVFPALLEQGQLCGHADGAAPFIDIGTPESLAAAEGFLRRWRGTTMAAASRVRG